MKDFYGTQLFTHAQLDYGNIDTIHNDFDDTTEKSLYYTPGSDGIFVLGCSYVSGSYIHIRDEDSPVYMRFVAGASGQGTPGQSSGIGPAYKGHSYVCGYKRGQLFFIPYKQ